MRKATIATVLLSFIPLISGCGGCSSKHDSPEAAFEAMQDAAQDDDLETAVEQMTDESQSVMAGGMVFALSFAAFNSENEDEIQSLFKEHGLDPDAQEDDEAIDGADMETALKKIVEPIDNKPEFVAAAIALMKKLDKDGDSSFDFPSGTLEDLKIDGDSATAVIVTTDDGDEDREPIEFRKVDGGWLVHIPTGAFGGVGSSDHGSMTAVSSNDGEEMGQFDEELPEPATIPEENVSAADLGDMKLTASLVVSSNQPDDLFGSFGRGTQFASVKLKGQPILDAYQYGHVQVEATDNSGQMLTLAQPLRGKFGGELGTEFVKLDPFFLDIKDELQFHMAFAPASAETKQISEASGTIKLKVRANVLIDDIQNKVGQTLSDPALASYGEFEVVATRDQDRDPATTIVLICKGKDHKHHKLAVVDRAGVVVVDHAWRFHGDDYTRYVLDANSALPAGTQLRITLSGSERILVVPLEVAK